MFSFSASSVASITANYVAQDDETGQGWKQPLDVTLVLCCPPCFSEVLQNPACILLIEHFHLNDAFKPKKTKAHDESGLLFLSPHRDLL